MKTKNICISLIITAALGGLFYWINSLLEYNNLLIYLSIISLLIFITTYKLLSGKVEGFNKVYLIIVSLFGLYADFTDLEMNVASERLNEVPTVREYDLKKSKILYLIVHTGILVLFLFVWYMLNNINNEIPNIITLLAVFVPFALIVVIPMFGSFLYATVSIKRISLKKKIYALLSIIIIAVNIYLAIVKINPDVQILVAVGSFLLLMFFLANANPKKEE